MLADRGRVFGALVGNLQPGQGAVGDAPVQERVDGAAPDRCGAVPGVEIGLSALADGVTAVGEPEQEFRRLPQSITGGCYGSGTERPPGVCMRGRLSRQITTTKASPPISGSPEIGMINTQVGYSRPAWAASRSRVKGFTGGIRLADSLLFTTNPPRRRPSACA